MVIASFKAQSNFPQNNIKAFKLTIIISIKKKKILQHIIISSISIIKQFLTTYQQFIFFLISQKRKISDLTTLNIITIYLNIICIVNAAHSTYNIEIHV